jgi:hypothetical protein
MAPHLITTGTASNIPSGAWLRLSAAFTAQIEELAGRDDLTVTCAPGAGHGAPGCFIPALATVELDGTHLGHPPATCDPRRPSDRERYAALWGVFVHEAAHARHTIWTAVTGANATQAVHEAAVALEESRIEAAHLRRRPADRRWLRAATHQLILADFTTNARVTTGAPQAEVTAWDAGRAAALLLARNDAGILDEDEVADLKATIIEVIGASRCSALAALWNIAHATADDDHVAMLELGRRWCAVLGADPEAPAPPPEEETGGENGAESSRPSPLAAAIAETLAAVTTADAPSPARSSTNRTEQRQQEHDARQRTRKVARTVFAKSTAGGPTTSTTAISGTRPPTPAEQAAARQLGRHLKAAAHRERVTVSTTSATPPGRLRMRGALAADAQRAAGAIPTAEPFSRTVRRHVPSPPLSVGIACDVSGSMLAFTRPVASAAWILARAAAHLPDARSATVIFGGQVRAVAHSGRRPAQVTEFNVGGRIEKFCQAVDALDGALDLTRPGTARLLVIVSDGVFYDEEIAGGQQRITRLTRAGCGVLWLGPAETTRPMDRAHLVTLTDPAQAAAAIGQAAVRALATT